MAVPGLTIDQLPRLNGALVTGDDLWVVRRDENGIVSAITSDDFLVWLRAQGIGSSGGIDPLEHGAYFDGQSHLVSSVYGTLAEAQTAHPIITSMQDEMDWVGLQEACYAAEAFNPGAGPLIQGSRGHVRMPHGLAKVNRVVYVPEKVALTGEGMTNTRIEPTFDSGVVMACIPYWHLADPGNGGLTPIGDVDGFILNNIASAWLDLSQTRAWIHPTADGAFDCIFDFRFDGPAGNHGFAGNYGSICAFGGSLTTWFISGGQGFFQQFALFVDGDDGNRLKVSNNGNIILTGPVVTVGDWFTIRIQITGGTAGTLTVNGTPQAFTCPVAFSWATHGKHMKFVFGGYVYGSWNWPEGPAGGDVTACPGRVKNLRFATSFYGGGYMVAPMTNVRDSLCFPTTTPGDGSFLLARPNNDQAPTGGQILSDFSVNTNSPRTIALYCENWQSGVISRLQLRAGYGVFFEKNCYASAVSDSYFIGAHVAYTALNNANQWAIVNCTAEGHWAFAISNCFGVKIVGGWCFHPGTGDGGCLLLASSYFNIDGLTATDEGSGGSLAVGYIRSGTGTIKDCNWARNYTPLGPCVLFENTLAGPYTIAGGTIAGSLGSGQPVLATVVGTQLGGGGLRIRVENVNNNQEQPAGVRPPWTSAADAAFFDIRDQNHHRAAVDVLTNAVLDTEVYAAAGQCGILRVKDATNSRMATYRVEDANLTADSVNAIFTTIFDNAATINVYVSSGRLRVQNKTAGTLSIACDFDPF